MFVCRGARVRECINNMCISVRVFVNYFIVVSFPASIAASLQDHYYPTLTKSIKN